MAAPVFRDSSYAFYNHTTDTVVSAPAGLQVGDLMLLTVIITAASGVSFSDLSWTTQDTAASTGGNQDAQMYLWSKVATPGDLGASYTISHSGNRNVVGIVAYSGADPTPVDVQSVSPGDSTTFTGPAASATSVPCTLVSIFGSECGNSNFNPPAITVGSGPTVRLNQADTFFAALAVAEDVQTSAGAGTARSASNTQTSSWVGFQVTLAPPPPPSRWFVGVIGMN